MTAAISAVGTPTASSSELQPAFQKAFAGMLFGQMMKAMRSTVGKPAYLHGGQAEELFQGQLDQTLVESLASTHGGEFVGELYDQFRRQMKLPAESAETLDPAQMEISLEQARSRSIANLVESSRRAQTGTDGMGITSDTTGLTALLRK